MIGQFDGLRAEIAFFHTNKMCKTVLITGAQTATGQQLISSLPRDSFKIIAALAPREHLELGLLDHCEKVIELDYNDRDTVNEAFRLNQIDYLFLIPSRSEERALEAKRLISVGMENNVVFHLFII